MKMIQSEIPVACLCALLMAVLLAACTPSAPTETSSATNPSEVTTTSSADRRSPLYPAKIDASWGYIDMTGEIVREPRFDLARPFSEGLAAVEVDGEWGYIDRSGDTVIEPRFEDADEFSEGFTIVEEDGSEAYIDRMSTTPE